MSDKTRLDQFLTYRLHRVARLGDRDVSATYLAACGLNVSEARCLVAVGAFEPLSLNDLARRANQDKGHASRSAQSLVDRGLIGKDASTDDARSVVLTLTRSGRALHAKTMKLIAERNATTFAALTVSERKTLGELLDRIAHSLESA